MKLSDFDFPFDESLIALMPHTPAHQARLLKIDGDQIAHLHVIDFIDSLTENDCIVINNTKVLKARLTGIIEKNQKSCELTLHQFISHTPEGTFYSAFMKGTKSLNPQDAFIFQDGKQYIRAVLHHKNMATGEVIIQFPMTHEDFHTLLDRIGTMPLPPYIAKKRPADKGDDALYQPIFAENIGSVAAPTASLHFNDTLMNKIKAKNIAMVAITLHVGGGTFLPVKTENIKDHHMHAEWIHLSEQTAEKIKATKQAGGRIIAIGTTVLRCLESCVDINSNLVPSLKETSIFITPPYDFKVVDMLLTNFHLPKSTLFMLVCAFAGTNVMQKAYAVAQKEKYRFFSYGDACLLTKA